MVVAVMGVILESAVLAVVVTYVVLVQLIAVHSKK
tara:strand:- start:20 stop:124 length:105 start_codon:yes stop_codon:yes gene_type:complete